MMKENIQCQYKFEDFISMRIFENWFSINQNVEESI